MVGKKELVSRGKREVFLRKVYKKATGMAEKERKSGVHEPNADELRRWKKTKGEDDRQKIVRIIKQSGTQAAKRMHEKFGIMGETVGKAWKEDKKWHGLLNECQERNGGPIHTKRVPTEVMINDKHSWL